MHKLSRIQLDTLAQRMQLAQLHQALQAELLDHLATLIEQRMDRGQDFSTAFEQVMQLASPQALDQLKQLYNRELTHQPAPVARLRLRAKRRPATKPFRYMLLSSVLTFLALMGFLAVVSRPLAVPVDAFQTVWGAGLAGLLGVLIVRWWLTHKIRKPTYLQPV